MSDDKQKITFSKNLNKYLSEYNKTQKEVADEIGVSPQTFNTWCQGIALPRMGKVQSLADYFHINKSDLIDEKSTTPALRILDYYNSLNDIGKREAEKRVEELTYIPQYTLEVKAAHNDHTGENGELEKIQKDLSILKRPN